MANEWIQSNGKACYNTMVSGFSLTQNDRFEIGLYYIFEITVSGMTAGKLVFDSFESKPEIIEDGTYKFFGKASQNNISITPKDYSGVFNGCVDDINAYYTPLYRIEDCEGNVIFELENNDDVENYQFNIQYGISWAEIINGTYKVVFEDDNITYESGCLRLGNQDCTLLLSWTNEENAGGFNYSDLTFTQNLRVKARLKDDFGKSIKRDLFRYSDGSKKILYAERDIEQILVIREMPAYLHRALMLGIDYDIFQIDGVEYIVDQEDYQPKWRNSSNLAPIELTVTKKADGFINQNCS